MPLNLTAPGDPAQVAWSPRPHPTLYTTGATAAPPPIYWNPTKGFDKTAITAPRAYSPPAHAPEPPRVEPFP